MGEQPHALGERPPAAGREQVVHPQVVARDVALRRSRRLGARLQRRPRGAQREAPGEPRCRPLAPRPALALRCHLLQRGEREVEQRHERELAREQVLAQVGAGIEGGEQLVDGPLRAQLQLAPAAQRAADLDQVAVELLQRGREAAEQLVPAARACDEPFQHERAQRRLVAVLVAPLGGHLPHPALDARALALAVLAHQLRDQLRRQRREGRRRRARGRGGRGGRGGGLGGGGALGLRGLSGGDALGRDRLRPRAAMCAGGEQREGSEAAQQATADVFHAAS